MNILEQVLRNSILLVFLFLMSCSTEADKRRKTVILDGHEYKIWRYDLKESKYCEVRFYFDENGRAEELLMPSCRSKYMIFPLDSEAGPSTTNHSWVLISDTLKCLGNRYLIKKTSKDTIYLVSLVNGAESYLVDVGLPPMTTSHRIIKTSTSTTAQQR